MRSPTRRTQLPRIIERTQLTDDNLLHDIHTPMARRLTQPLLFILGII